jgi:hypothetical protein
VSAVKAGGAARIVLGLLYPRWLRMTYHGAAGGGRMGWRIARTGIPSKTARRQSARADVSHAAALGGCQEIKAGLSCFRSGQIFTFGGWDRLKRMDGRGSLRGCALEAP